MKKVGIITFHCADNYGAVLQVFALMEVIKANNFNVEIIDYSPIEIINPYTQFINIKYSIDNKGYLKTTKEIIKRIFDYKKIKTRIKNFSEFRKDYLNLSVKKYLTELELTKDRPKYDFYITGSDQVWNPDFFLKTGGAYFLDFADKTGVKISYAASIAKQVEEKHLIYYEQYLKNFDYISVRENSAKEILSKYTDKEVSVTVDPTLLISKERWSEIATYNNKTKYILVYDLIKDPVTVSIANKIAKNYNCKIISYSSGKGYDNWYCSFSVSSPTEFLGLVENAEFIVTSSFHGTAFAIIFNKPFYTIPHPTRGSRMIDLLHDLGLNERIINTADNFSIANKDIDYVEVNNNLIKLRENSYKFLNNALGIKN
jgi:polysaccharide pyruvyl transferase WcaK-like protein